MGSSPGFRFSGRALIIFAVASFIISGLLIGTPSEPTNAAFTTETNESQVSPDAEIVSYNNLSAAGQDVFDQALRTDGAATVDQSPPDFDYPGDTMDYTYVEKKRDNIRYRHWFKYMQGVCLRGVTQHRGWLAGVILLLRGVSRLVNGEADATEG